MCSFAAGKEDHIYRGIDVSHSLISTLRMLCLCAFGIVKTVNDESYFQSIIIDYML